MSVSDLGKCKMVLLKVYWVDNVVPEGGIAARVLIFVFRHEESLAATDTGVNTHIFVPPISTCEWPLSSSSLSQVELIWRQFPFKVLPTQTSMFIDPSFKGRIIFESPWLSVLSFKQTVTKTAILFIDNYLCHLLLSRHYPSSAISNFLHTLHLNGNLFWLFYRSIEVEDNFIAFRNLRL